jgi:hypothetical protein
MKKIEEKDIKNLKKYWPHKPILCFPMIKIEKHQFSELIRLYLNINVSKQSSNGFHKVYLGNGNNSSLIGKCLKEKGYWTVV